MTSPVHALVGQQVRAPKTAEIIAAHLRRQVVRGELQAGEALPPEMVLMEQFKVSRPTLREAFRILETESLITVRRGSRGGAQVVSPDISVAARYVGVLLQVSGTTIADVYEARMVLEPAAASMLAGRRTKQDIADLDAAIEKLNELVESPSSLRDPNAWTTATTEFHDLVLDRAGNKTLAIQAGVLRDIVATHMSLAVNRTFDNPDNTDDFRRTIRSYRKLLRLIEARDTAGAEKHWRTHMEAAAQNLLNRAGLGSTSVVDLFS